MCVCGGGETGAGGTAHYCLQVQATDKPLLTAIRALPEAPTSLSGLRRLLGLTHTPTQDTPEAMSQGQGCRGRVKGPWSKWPHTCV